MTDQRSSRQDDTVASSPSRVGFWLYALHLATVWGLALSNAIQGLTLLWTGARWPRLRLTRQDLQEAGGVRLLRPFVLYVLVLIASVVTSFQVRESLWELRALIGLTTLPLGILLVRGELQVRRVYDVLIWVSLAMAWFGILQYAFTDLGGLQSRIPGPFGHYMTYSGVMLLGVCLALARLMTATDKRRWLHWLVLLRPGADTDAQCLAGCFRGPDDSLLCSVSALVVGLCDGGRAGAGADRQPGSSALVSHYFDGKPGRCFQLRPDLYG